MSCITRRSVKTTSVGASKTFPAIVTFGIVAPSVSGSATAPPRSGETIAVASALGKRAPDDGARIDRSLRRARSVGIRLGRERSRIGRRVHAVLLEARLRRPDDVHDERRDGAVVD